MYKIILFFSFLEVINLHGSHKFYLHKIFSDVSQALQRCMKKDQSRNKTTKPLPTDILTLPAQAWFSMHQNAPPSEDEFIRLISTFFLFVSNDSSTNSYPSPCHMLSFHNKNISSGTWKREYLLSPCSIPTHGASQSITHPTIIEQPHYCPLCEEASIFY